MKTNNLKELERRLLELQQTFGKDLLVGLKVSNGNIIISQVKRNAKKKK